jgi:hypothetical protein
MALNVGMVEVILLLSALLAGILVLGFCGLKLNGKRRLRREGHTGG